MRTSKPRARSRGVAWQPEPVCSFCGKKGAHYIPASMGEPSFVICNGLKETVQEASGVIDWYAHVHESEVMLKQFATNMKDNIK